MENERGRIKIVPVAILLLTIVGIAYWLNPSLLGGDSHHIYDTKKRYGVKGKVKVIDENRYLTVQKFGDWEVGKIANFGNNFNRYNYNEKGLLKSIEAVSDTTIASSGKILAKQTPKYDNENKLIEISFVENDSGELISLHKFKYEAEKIGVTYIYDKDGKLFSVFKDYFDNNYNLVRSERGNIVTSDEKIFINYIYLYEYNEKGLLVSLIPKDKDGINEYEFATQFTYEYLDFDKKGNWTKALRKENGTPYILYRKIEYY